ncbi:hypothetical protein KPH14_003316 [Odynerus spinipes]|uniref:Peroxisomal membrane protein PMP34 n=1 Tax=Odynerus spinipes TaxID=1348599 RepID=A0AAD9VJS9_9HYME|nr:hypothetical protein KPH14_003316 [Odynerus spinipes]
MGGNDAGRSIFSYETLVHALSGAAGSVIAMATFFPLDTVRSRLQLEENREAKNTLATIRELASKEGPHTLYRGMVPVLQSLCASNFVYFYTFHGLKTLRSKKHQTAGNDLLVASVAGVINVLTTTPLWVVNTRLKMKGIGNDPERNNNEYNTLYDGLIHIWKYEGLEKLWAGTLPSLLLVANPAIQFMTYESIKRRVGMSLRDAQPPAWVFFAIGAIAKTIATTLTYPLQLVQMKLRHGHKYPDLPPNAGTIQILFHILKKQGIFGLYKGMEAKLLQTVLTAALMFLTYEKISRFVFLSPLLQTPRSLPKWLSDEVDLTKVLDSKDRALAKINRKRFKTILRFWSKVKARKDSKKRLDTSPVTSSWGFRHAGETMNAQVRNEIAKTKKLISSQQNNARVNNKQDTKVKTAVAYDYDAAVSQPDVPNFLGQKYNSSLPSRKKGYYSRGKSRLSIRKTAQSGSEDSSASNAKSQDKENEVQVEDAKDSKIDYNPAKEIGVSRAEEEMAKHEIISTNDESTPIYSKNDYLKSGALEKDRRKLDSEQKDKFEGGENVGNSTPRSNTLLKKDSKIPRTKATSPAVIHVSRSDSVKRFSSAGPKRSLEAIAHKKDVKQEGSKKQVQSKFVSSKQQNLNTLRADKHERDDETIITETTPAVIGSASDPSTFVVLQELEQNQECQSCNDCNLESSCRDVDDTLSDSRSSPERRYVQKKWRRSLKYRKYIDTSSDDLDVSSDCSSHSSEKKISTNPVAPFTKSSLSKSSSRSRNRRGSSFSFFNTLFDIVFWPFLFLKSDR